MPCEFATLRRSMSRSPRSSCMCVCLTNLPSKSLWSCVQQTCIHMKEPYILSHLCTKRPFITAKELCIFADWEVYTMISAKTPYISVAEAAPYGPSGHLPINISDHTIAPQNEIIKTPLSKGSNIHIRDKTYTLPKTTEASNHKVGICTLRHFPIVS